MQNTDPSTQPEPKDYLQLLREYADLRLRQASAERQAEKSARMQNSQNS